MSVVAERADRVAPPVRKTRADAGLWGWITTVDHKRIGILYLVTGLLFFVVGAVYAGLIRLQLMTPERSVITGDLYNQVLTMHGITMIFFAATPIIAAFFNFLLPLMIGARDVAYPRLNMISYWLFLAGGIIVTSSWFLGGAPDPGWFMYAPLSEKLGSPGRGVDFLLVGLQIASLGSTISAFNFIVTVLRMRAPGMGLMQMPPFVWGTFLVSWLVIVSFPPFTAAMALLMLDRWFGTGFYLPAQGGDPLLWQHLFWFMGHPEVYILALPAFTIIAEILPVFSGKPLFAYRTFVFGLLGISCLSAIVWAHHMFTVGMGTAANVYFTTATKMISVPTGLLVLCWLGTLWRGKLRFTTPMLYALGFLFVFTNGGLTGLVNASPGSDRQLQDTYWVVSHFHYVAIGGVLFALLAGISYWFPKMTGRMMNDSLGKLSFWFVFVGFNLTFGPQIALGVLGMPRRVYTYIPDTGFGPLNSLSTIGSWTLAAGILILIGAWVLGLVRGRPAPADPWDGHTLEWSIPSPAPAYNFARIPVVRGRGPGALWYEKLHGDGKMRTLSEEEDHHVHRGAVHMPPPSAMPAVTTLGLAVAGYGAVFASLAAVAAGLLILLAGVVGWGLEDTGGYYLETEEGRSA